MKPKGLGKVYLWVVLTLASQQAWGQHFKHAESQVRLETPSNNNGIAAADIDGDYDMDLFIVTRQNPNQINQDIASRLYLNNGDGTFTDISGGSGIEMYHDYSNAIITWDFGLKMGASWGDIDNDGYPDLFLTSRYHLRLYRNNGDLTFTDITENAGITAEIEAHADRDQNDRIQQNVSGRILTLLIIP